MKQELFPFAWNSNVIHQLKRYQIHTNVEPHLAPSLTNVLDPIRVREFPSSMFLERVSQFWTHRIPMTVILIITTYQSHDTILRFRLKESLH